MKLIYALASLLLLTSCVGDIKSITQERTTDSPTLLVPAYSGSMAKKAYATHGKAKLCLILNPNSGPGKTVDAEYASIFKSHNTCSIVAYVDLKLFPGDGIFSTTKTRWKTLEELSTERELYRKLYSHTQGWFFDDGINVPPNIISHIKSWGGERIRNPGSVDKILPEFTTIVYEDNNWLKAPNPKSPSTCGAIALNVDRSNLNAALSKASRLKYFFVTDLDDKWQQGSSAYNKLPAYWSSLVSLASQ